MDAAHVPYPGENSCQGQCGQTIYNPSVPYTHELGSLYPGKMFFISGIPLPDSAKFSINFKSVCGQTKSNAFHFDVRFDYGNSQNVIVRNAHINGSWGKEERSINGSFPFRRDMFFEMTILVDKECFKVAVNNEHILEFKHRVQVERIERFNITNDVRITKIRIQG